MPLGIGMTPEKYVEIAYSKAPTLLTTASDLPRTSEASASLGLAYFVECRCCSSRYSAPEESATAAYCFPSRSLVRAIGVDVTASAVIRATRLVVSRDMRVRLPSIHSTAMNRPTGVSGVTSP